MEDCETIKVEEIAEFLWGAEYHGTAFPWARLSVVEQRHYVRTAEALARRYEIAARR